MRSARDLVAARFVDNQRRRLLHWHRDTFWLFQSGRYRSADDRIRANVWQFLETARLDAKGNPPFKPTSHNVSNVVDALGAVCYLDGGINPPAWLDNSSDHPNAAELLGVGNGLLHLPTATLILSIPSYFNLTASDVSFIPRRRRRNSGWRSSISYSATTPRPSPRCKIGSVTRCRPTLRSRRS
jgi:hypothetical protein